jgi:hypothetical protein
MMKTIVGATIVALVLAASAEAAQPGKQKKRLAQPTAAVVSPTYQGAQLFPSGPVMYGNEYLGTDPDPFIRSQLLRDLGAHFGGAD